MTVPLAWLGCTFAFFQGDPPMLWEFVGTQPYDRFGYAVKGIGDVDADGSADVAVSAPYQNIGTTVQAGQVKVFSGASGAVLLTLNGTLPSGMLGLALARPGDLNGDAVPDIAVAPIYQVYSGADGSLLLSLPAGIPEGAGDVDGDGIPDLLRGYPSPTVSNPNGLADVWSGASGTVLFTFTGSPAGTGPWELFGFSLAASDLDGDGVPDFVIGAPGMIGAYGWPGYVSAFSGANASILWTMSGPTASFNERFGYSVATMGDLDGDGISEVIVGIPYFPYFGSLGQAQVISGATTTLLRVFTGSPSFNTFQLGLEVAAPGDIDGDGFEEVLVTGHSAAVVFSTAPGATTPLWAPPSATNLLFYGTPGGPAEAGDVNADGFPDVVVGSPCNSVCGPYPGRARVLSGAPLGVTVYGSGCPGSTGLVPRVGITRKAQIGTPFPVHVSRAPSNIGALLILGFSDTSWLGIPLPLNLAFLGLPACALRVSADASMWVVTSPAPTGGAATAVIPIPPDATLVGGHFFGQWLLAALGSGSMTRAFRAQIY